MGPLLRLARALIRPQLRLHKAHALRRAEYGMALAVLAGLAGFFALALVTLLLVLWLGLLWALAVEFVAFAIGAGVVYAIMRAETRRQARESALLAEIQKQELRAALIAALPATRGFGLAAAGIAIGLAVLLATSGSSGDGDDGDSDT